MSIIEESNIEQGSSTESMADMEVEPEHSEINDQENSLDMMDDDFEEELSDSNEDDSNSESEIKGSGNAAWADAMGRVLNTNIPKPKNFILSKAKKDSDVKVQGKEEIELVDDSGNVSKAIKTDKDSKVKTYKEQRQEMLERQKQKAEWENMCRVKPSIIKKEKERELVRIATRGVVHLFNTVEKHQKSVKNKNPKEKNSSKKSLGAVKGTFMDILKGHCKRQQQTEEDPVIKREETWSILKDDFMMGAEMKDWDKNSDDDA